MNEGWDINDLASALGALEVHGYHKGRIRHVLTDSRRLSFPGDTVFFALRSEKDDGHRYIDALVASGVRVFVVDHLPELHGGDATFVVVNDTLEALQRLAADWRSRFDLPVLGITGSNGKTVVKEWIHQLMQGAFRIVRSPRSYNSQIGVPLSLFHMRDQHQLAVIEAGISQVGEMERLAEMIRPGWGIVTNLGDAHQEHFADRITKLREKLELFREAGHLIYCTDHREIHEAILGHSRFSRWKCFTWAQSGEADIHVRKVSHEAGKTTAEVLWKDEVYNLELPFTDDASLENAMHAITFALAFGMEPKALFPAARTLAPVAMRLELKKARNNASIINDAYNSDPQSIRIALDFLGQQQQHQRHVVVLSDLEQSGTPEDELYGHIADMIRERRVDEFIGIGEKMARYADRFNAPARFYPTTEDFIASLPEHNLADSAILLKGARHFAFENIARQLEDRVHQTVLEINLSAMAANLNYYRRMLRPETRLMAMVKAFSYGAGNYEIAHLLAFHNIDWLAVAYADEGVALRQAGVHARIVVLNPGEESFEQIIEYRLEPEIYSFRMLRAFYRSLQSTPGLLAEEVLPIHIKVDTGMHRLGFEADQMEELAGELSTLPGLRVATVFSHLAASDSPEHETFTREQITTFKAAADVLESGLDYPVLRHILNSSGIHNYLDHQMDMVRLGIGLYGISSATWERHHLQPVSRLITRISQIRQIEPGDSVSYGRRFVANRQMRIATLPVGYADGMRRSLSDAGGAVWINGRRAPIVGSVCMDMMMVDVSTIECREGDQAELFGDHISVYELAENMGTIPYEVLTAISSRVKRVYFQE